MQTTPPLKHAHLQKFQLETLFHMFYSMPKDLLQALDSPSPVCARRRRLREPRNMTAGDLIGPQRAFF